MWVYLKSEPGLWTVGFYDPEGRWHAESDYDNREEAAGRVNWLNGGTGELPTRIDARPYERLSKIGMAEEPEEEYEEDEEEDGEEGLLDDPGEDTGWKSEEQKEEGDYDDDDEEAQQRSRLCRFCRGDVTAHCCECV